MGRPLENGKDWRKVTKIPKLNCHIKVELCEDQQMVLSKQRRDVHPLTELKTAYTYKRTVTVGLWKIPRCSIYCQKPMILLMHPWLMRNPACSSECELWLLTSFGSFVNSAASSCFHTFRCGFIGRNKQANNRDDIRLGNDLVNHRW